MEIPYLQQNGQVNFRSKVFIKNCSEILKRKNIQNQIARLKKNGTDDIVSLRAYQSHRDGSGYVSMNIINHNTCEEREKDFFFKAGKLKLGWLYRKLLKEKSTNAWFF